MAVTSWLVWLALTAVAVALSLWHYRRRETPGRGRAILALLRAGALSLIVLLLLDPELPRRGSGGRGGTQVLLDASLSMSLPAEPGGPTRWQRGVETAQDRAGGAPVLLFGAGARPVAPDSLPAEAPGDGQSRLLPALQAAAEAGARGVTVITDGALEDADQVGRWAARLGLRVESVTVGAPLPNRTVAEVGAPAWLQSGQPAIVEFGVAGGAADSVAVVARRDGRVIGRATTGPASAGRLATGRMELQLEPPAGGGWVRLEVALEEDDVVPDDDVRTVYIHVSDEPAGIALVSFRPDWEPRFLAPVLQQALGLPLHAWIRGATGQYVRLAAGLDAGTPADDAAVSAAVGRAELVVLHGVGQDAPVWAIEALSSARRLLVFPADQRVPLPLPIGAEQQTDFYIAPVVPASPLAGLLAGIETTGAAPLATLRPTQLPPGVWTPLHATRGRQGDLLPIVAAAEQGGRRWAVALGSGYWNWAFRGGAERQTYERLWGALAGWLARERGTATLAAVRPAAPALPRAVPVPWIAPGLAIDSMRLQLIGADGATAQDTVLRSTAADTLYAAAPDPGHYSYRARAFSGDTVTDAEGVLTIERYSPELARPVGTLSDAGAAGTLVRTEDGTRRGTPLHATWPPWLLLLALLSTEWILRRRWGLR